jgi:putative ABC transport system permease protein
LTLALGIGANTAIFSVVNAVLLRPLPYPHPEHLVTVWESVGPNGTNPVAYPNYVDWRAQNQVFEDLAAYSRDDFNLAGDGKAERVVGEVVTDSYFPVLGVKALRGRTFLPEENQTPMAHPVALIGYGLWRRRYGGDLAAIGRTLSINEARYTIVGVMPPSFRGLRGLSEVWIPMMMRDAAWPQTAQFDFLHNRDIHWHLVVGRLRQGITLERARADMAAIGVRLETAYPKENRDRGIGLAPVQAHLVRDLRSPLYVLLGAVGFVLLISCANVANLLLVRAAGREREISVRVALGAGRGRLLRLLLTEGVMLALLGGSLGIGLSVAAVQVLTALFGSQLPDFAPIRVDGSVLAFTFVISVVTGALLALLPALRATRVNLNESLKEGAKDTGGVRGQRISGALVISEMALALVLMTGAGLLLRSFESLLRVNPGFRADHLLTMRFDIPNAKYAGDARQNLGLRLLDRVTRLPGVESAALTYTDPYVWDGINRGYSVEGHARITNEESDEVYCHEVSPNYFRTMGIPLLAGRDFSTQDGRQAPRVVIVNEAFARRYWPAESAVGKRIKYGPLEQSDPKYGWMPLVGVVANTKFSSLQQDQNSSPVIYGPLTQSEVIINLSLLVRTKGDPLGMAETLRRSIQDFDSDMPVYSVASLEDRIAGQAGGTRSYAVLLGLFAGLALALSGVGIYGVMAYGVARRAHELGIRMALGAQRRDVLRLVARRGLALTLAGTGIGLAAAFALTRLMASILFGVTPTDGVTFAAVAVLLWAVALLACYIPARRATRVNPLVALRYE